MCVCVARETLILSLTVHATVQERFLGGPEFGVDYAALDGDAGLDVADATARQDAEDKWFEEAK